MRPPPEVVAGLPALTAFRLSVAGGQHRVAGPVMLGGTWMPELITVAGGDPLGAAAGAGPDPGRPCRPGA